ncbi:uncharacterized protein LOC114848204 [Betta splendens]|uniref:Uncharacterized protein LOC114848204 n=1 Tax=Betta splendens TaxID=158456 RepID=A0A6P7LKJ4_BETSP|nr:uncharacterized protein LOC114848204 [Betta splendens]
MASRCWMAVVLTVLLTEHILAVDQNRLADIVNGILRQYGTQGMFSLAVTIPENQNLNINQVLQQVFQSDPAANVRNKLNNNEVYIGNRVVAAKRYTQSFGTDHAESRVVDHLSQIFNNSTQNDLLFFYVFASPCVEKCSSSTHRQNILGRIQSIRRWRDWAFVFSVIFRPNNAPENTEEQRQAALQRLGNSVDLNKIFRCYGRQCTSCYSNGQVAQYCISD